MKNIAIALLGLWIAWAVYCIVISMTNPYQTVHWGFGFLIIAAILFYFSNKKKKKLDDENWLKQNVEGYTQLIRQSLWAKKSTKIWLAVFIVITIGIVLLVIFDEKPKPYVNPHFPYESTH